MAASINDHFCETTNGTRPSVTDLTAQKTVGATSISCTSLSDWETTTATHFIMYTLDAQGNKIAGTQTDWKGIVSGDTITNMELKAGTDTTYPIGTVVECAPTAAWADDVLDGVLVEHGQSGVHTNITGTSAALTGTLSVASVTWANLITGWINSPLTWTYVSATSFKITGQDVTALFPKGTKIKLTQTSTKYFYVTGAAFSTDTTVTITGGSDYTLANAAITSPMYSYAASPQGFPYKFVYSASYTNMTVGAGGVLREFSMQGDMVDLRWYLILAADSAVSSAPTVSLPVTAASNYVVGQSLGLAEFLDSGGSTWAGRAYYASTTTFGFRTFATPSGVNPLNIESNTGNVITGAAPFSFATGDTIVTQIRYKAA